MKGKEYARLPRLIQVAASCNRPTAGPIGMATHRQDGPGKSRNSEPTTVRVRIIGLANLVDAGTPTYLDVDMRPVCPGRSRRHGLLRFSGRSFLDLGLAKA